ncbi:MAG: hypothetical protein ACRDF0_00540 [Candidatus Limnocylindria bacterium]
MLSSIAHAATRLLVIAALVMSGLMAGGGTASANHGKIFGFVTDAVTGAPLDKICLTLGPPIACWFPWPYTDANGYYEVDLGALQASDGGQWDMWFIDQEPPNGRGIYESYYTGLFVVNGPTQVDVQMVLKGVTPPPSACGPESTATPTQSVFLPNITKTLGGPSGWYTPFIVQNTGTATTNLEVSFYKFTDGTCVKRQTVAGLAPGTSFAHISNNDSALPHDTQFSVVVRSFGAPIVAVVNQHQGSGSLSEALSYVGASTGASTVYLPNITRRFFGYVTPFIIQNLGSSITTATASFVPFDGSHGAVTVQRVIDPGRSKFIDPNSETGLMDGKQYAVTVTSSQLIAVVVNSHADAPGTAAPVAYSANGVTGGAATLHGPYAAKNAQGVGRFSTIVVQNLGSSAVTPTLTFTPLGGVGTPQSFTAPSSVAPGSSWAFDPRFTLGTTTPCSGASATCLGDGEFSVVLSVPSGTIAASINVHTSTTAMGYAAIPANQVATKFFLPNVTRTLGGASGWTTPILLQTVSATGATLRWYRFSDGALVHTQTVAAAAGTGVRIDPRSVSALSDDTQYAVVVDGTAGTVTAIVIQLASGGDNAMIYEGFPAP